MSAEASPPDPDALRSLAYHLAALANDQRQGRGLSAASLEVIGERLGRAFTGREARAVLEWSRRPEDVARRLLSLPPGSLAQELETIAEEAPRPKEIRRAPAPTRATKEPDEPFVGWFLRPENSKMYLNGLLRMREKRPGFPKDEATPEEFLAWLESRRVPEELLRAVRSAAQVWRNAPLYG